MSQLFSPYSGRGFGRVGFGITSMLSAMFSPAMPIFDPLMHSQVVSEPEDRRFTAEDWQLFEYRGKRNRRNKIAKASRKRNRQ